MIGSLRGTVASVLLAVFMLCSFTARTDAASAPVRVAAVVSLSGPYAAVGSMESAALTFAARIVNRQGGINGRRFVLDIRDDASSPARAIALTRYLLTTEHPLALFGGSVTPICEAMRFQTDAMQTVQYCLSGGKDAGGTYFASFPQPGRLFGDLPASWMRSRGLGRAAVLQGGDDVGAIYAAHFRRAAAVEQIAITGIERAGASPQVAVDRALAAHPDVVYLAADEGGNAAFLRALRARDSRVPVWIASSVARAGVAWKLGPLLPQADVYAAGDTIGVAEQLPATDPRRLNLLRFIAQFQAMAGVRPDIYAAVAADAMEFVVAALRADGAVGGPLLAGTIERTPPSRGLYAAYRFGPDRHIAADVPGTVVKLSADGRLVYVETVPWQFIPDEGR